MFFYNLRVTKVLSLLNAYLTLSLLVLHLFSPAFSFPNLLVFVETNKREMAVQTFLQEGVEAKIAECKNISNVHLLYISF